MTHASSQPISESRSDAEHINPHFSISRTEAKRILHACAASPVVLQRPIFVIAGYHSPRFTILPFERALRRSVQNPELVHAITSPLSFSIEHAAENAKKQIERLAQHDEIDIVGHSLGGVAARLLLTSPGLPRVRRLFTMATPHRGAIVAPFAPVDSAARALHPQSSFLAALNSTPLPESIELVCYARLYDWWVGARNCAPPGHSIYWLDADTAFSRLLGHFSITRDERILADCIRRIRNESPLAAAASIPPRH